MTSDQAPTATTPAPPAPSRGRGLSSRWFLLIGGVIIANILAFLLVPPFPREGSAGQDCPYPACFIEGTLEFPAPHVVYDFDPANAPGAEQLITFHPSISSTILTMWIVMVIVLVGAILMTRGGKLIPGRAQNLFEWFYEFL